MRPNPVNTDAPVRGFFLGERHWRRAGYIIR